MTRAILWTAEDVVKATGAKGSPTWRSSGVSIDTRSLTPGDLFVALEGPNFDGHDFVAQAFDRGATGAIVSKYPVGRKEDPRLLLVPNTLDALTRLGAAGRARFQGKVVGITGSAGKTGTKEALRLCLSGQGGVSASAASLNNHWGVPLSLSRCPADADFCLQEMGMNHAGELSVLTRFTRPHVAIITNIGLAHLAHFQSREGIAYAKAEIFEGLERDGIAVLPRDDDFYDLLKSKAEASAAGGLVTFGRHEEADVRLIELKMTADDSQVVADIAGQKLAFRVGMAGEHWVMNSLGILAIVMGLGADVERAAQSLGRLQGLKGRGQRQEIPLGDGGSLQLIDESYNANPISVAASIKVLGNIKPKGRRIAILGDMLELGEQSKALHAGLAEVIAEAKINKVFTCGEDMAALHKALPRDISAIHAANSEELSPLVLQSLQDGDAVMIKGSLGSKMAVIVRAIEAMDLGPALQKGRG